MTLNLASGVLLSIQVILAAKDLKIHQSMIPFLWSRFFMFSFSHVPCLFLQSPVLFKCALSLGFKYQLESHYLTKTLQRRVRIQTPSVRALELSHIFSSCELPAMQEHISWNRYGYTVIPATCHHPCQQWPSPKFLLHHSLKLKDLSCSLSELWSQTFLLVLRTTSTACPSIPLGLCTKGYSNGYNTWVPLHFHYICLIILQESICPLFGNVLIVEPGKS